MYKHNILVAIMCFIKISSADLESCTVKNDNQLCYTGEKYEKPLPAIVDTKVILNQIHEIDHNANSIGVHMEFITTWTDPYIVPSNISALG